MTKSELAKVVARKSGTSIAKAGDMINALTEAITDELVKGNQVGIQGFGTFKTTKRPARDGVNPATGEKMHIAASRSPAFKAGSSLKAAVKGR